MDLISWQTLGAGVGTVTFSSIPQTYTDLRFIIMTRSASTADVDSLYMRFNTDTASNYLMQQWTTNNNSTATATPVVYTAAQVATYGFASSANVPTYGFTFVDIVIPNYSSSNTIPKTYQAESSCVMNGAAYRVRESNHGAWKYGFQNATNTAITSVLFYNSSASLFSLGSTFYMYGVTHA